MVYAFAFPLALGALPFGWMAMRRRALPCSWCCRLYHTAVATFTVGSIVQGVLAIYGTTNQLTIAYWIAGGCLLLAGAIVGILHRE